MARCPTETGYYVCCVPGPPPRHRGTYEYVLLIGIEIDPTGPWVQRLGRTEKVLASKCTSWSKMCPAPAGEAHRVFGSFGADDLAESEHSRGDLAVVVEILRNRCRRYEQHMADHVPMQYWPEVAPPKTDRADDQEPQPETGTEACFYVLDVRQTVGNCAMWWCPDSQGYTCEIGKAGLYTAEQCKDMRETDIPVHRDIVARMTIQHVRVDHLRQSGVISSVPKRGTPS